MRQQQPRIASSRHQQKGIATVELALLMPTIMLLILGTIELSLLLWTQTVLHHAVQAIARFAMVRGQTAVQPASAQDLINELQRHCISMDVNRLNIEVNPPWPMNSSPGAPLQIRVSYSFEWSWPFAWADSGVNLQSEVSTTVSQ